MSDEHQPTWRDDGAPLCDEERRSEAIEVRVSPVERAAAERGAELAGVEIADWIRALVAREARRLEKRARR